MPKAEKTEGKVENFPVFAPAEKEEKIEFSKVEIEPLFADFVDFETFSKSDFRAVKVLDMILNAQVSKVGCQVDMVQYRYEEYCFVFGAETVTFGFLPHSYFCYNNQDYELGENRISAVCDSLHAMTECEDSSIALRSSRNVTLFSGFKGFQVWIHIKSELVLIFE